MNALAPMRPAGSAAQRPDPVPARPAASLEQLLAGLATPTPELAGQIPAGLHLDSRRIQPGDAFVAVAGDRGHGLEFAGQALAAGACCVIHEAPAPARFAIDLAGWPAIAVPGLREHLGRIADRAWQSPSRRLDCIGVTGTNGKTSTVHLLVQALAGAGIDVASIGTLGSGRPGALVPANHTTPDVLSVHAGLRSFADAGISHVAMEVSSHALDQGRVDQIYFRSAVFTNLSRDHLDYHGDMAAYGEAKARLFAREGLRAAVINIDDAFGAALPARIAPGIQVLRTSAAGGGDADIAARDIVLDDAGIAFSLRLCGSWHAVACPLLGRFNVDNLLAVAGALQALGHAPADIARVLSRLEPIPGRMNRFGGGDALPLVVVDYSHKPDPLAQALQSLRGHLAGELVCVFGCGGERDAGKRPQMAAIAEAGADRVIVTDDNPRNEDGDAIVADILAGFARRAAVTVERDRARAIHHAILQAKAGDIVLIAGKGHEPYQEIAGVQHAFDDRVVACNALAAHAAAPQDREARP